MYLDFPQERNKQTTFFLAPLLFEHLTYGHDLTRFFFLITGIKDRY